MEKKGQLAMVQTRMYLLMLNYVGSRQDGD